MFVSVNTMFVYGNYQFYGGFVLLGCFGFFKSFLADACIECCGAPSCAIGCYYTAVSGSPMVVRGEGNVLVVGW